MKVERLHIPQWPEYELIDSGDFEKLERFGAYVLRRPEPQALWSKSMPEAEWEKMAHASFSRKSEKDPENGNWSMAKGMPDRWLLPYRSDALSLQFRLALTSFKHVGVFPEQAANWEYIAQALAGKSNMSVLNLFAYTGGASLAARQHGADVVHVDSIKAVVSWSRENMEHTRLDDIRWVVEDAFKFVQREVRRGKQYQGIILDPPAYGRGPNGEKWVLERQINELLALCAQLLAPRDSFLILNTYSMGLSPVITENLIREHFGAEAHAASSSGELLLTDRAGRQLPTGNYLRFQR
ncbi:MAG: hypothetical protein RL577_1001 [Bacteroidota bacterium]|jgi:23S rRNA (cytosine1962-C5)-methyltransferase